MIAITFPALLLVACRQTRHDAGRRPSRSNLPPTAADSVRADLQKAGLESATAVTHKRLTPLTVLPTAHAVCRLNSGAPVPRWATISTGGLSSVTRTEEELSIIVVDSLAPRNVRCERDWRAIKVRGPIPLNLIGIIAGISSTLARAGISIFAFSTFDTDYVMVKQENLDRAVNALHRAEYPILGPLARDSACPCR